MAGIYLVLALAAGAYAWYGQTYRPASAELAALPIIMLGVPWSLWLGPLVDPTRVALEWAVIVGSVALNAVLLFALGRLVARVAANARP